MDTRRLEKEDKPNTEVLKLVIDSNKIIILYYNDIYNYQNYINKKQYKFITKILFVTTDNKIENTKRVLCQDSRVQK